MTRCSNTVDSRVAAETLRAATPELAAMSADLSFERMPRSEPGRDPGCRDACFQDVLQHLAFLEQAVATSTPNLFVQYAAWRVRAPPDSGVTAPKLIETLTNLSETIDRELPTACAMAALTAVQAAIAALESPVEEEQSYLQRSSHPALARSYMTALLGGDRRAAARIVKEAVEDDVSVRDIYLEVLEPSQRELGRLWFANRITVAQEHFSTAVTQLVMSQLYETISETPRNGLRIVTTCALGDLHEVGVRMVSDFLEMHGWDSIYLGANTPTDAVIDAVRAHDAHVLGLSATITTHVREVAAVIEMLRAQPDLAHVKVLVGGCPFTANPELHARVGADAFGSNGEEAVRVARRLAS